MKVKTAEMGQETSEMGQEPLRFPRSLRNTKLCKYYQKGACTRGNSCTFAHSVEQLHSRPDFIKTSYCNMFLVQGWCSWGTNCKFAHGEQELRSKMPEDQTGTMPAHLADFQFAVSSSLIPRASGNRTHLFQFGIAARENYCAAAAAVDVILDQTREAMKAPTTKNKIPREHEGRLTAVHAEKLMHETIERLTL
eukprot:TRINITY_DN88372_c0_g1_i1.p1 TRINITY_DN88372_c0_g1~~TRINITY_DN88372_c0_g1_i1.p1  ORF type:complete len:194 (-),score=26.60 TRINITY_DN88372_c0_g1_i1:362-943(-)